MRLQRARFVPPDVFGTRLMRAGCALMLLAPLIFVIGLGVAAWPAMLQLLPRGTRPVTPARNAESLMLITTLRGDDDSQATTQLDDALVSLTQRYYLYNTRVEWLNETPATAEEARALGEDYAASFVIWGQNAEQTTTYTLEILQPLDFTEPRSLAFEVGSPPSERSTDALARLLMALFALHNNDTYTADTLLRNMPTNSDLFGGDESTLAYYLAKTQIQSSSYTAARMTISQALEDDPDNIYLLALSAQVAESDADIQTAIDALTTILDAISTDDQRAQALQLRANLYTRAGQLDEATTDLTAAADLSPEDGFLLNQLVTLYTGRENYQAALEVMPRLIEEQPNTIRPYLTRAAIYEQLGQREQALADYATALTQADTNTARIAVLNARGYAHLAAGNTQAARTDFESIRSLGVPSNEYSLGLGLSYWLEDERSTARSLWEGSYGIILTQTIGYAENNLAWELVQAGYPEPALFYSDLSLSVEPTNPNFLHTHGVINLESGDYEAALTDFSDALLYNFQGPIIYRDLGHTFFALQQWEEAISYYEDYLRLSTPNPADLIDVTHRITQAQTSLAETNSP